MTNDDDGVDSESFLTGTGEADGVSFPLASGLDVGSIGRTIIGSVGFTVALGVSTVVDAWENSVAGLITGVEEFIAGGTRALSTIGSSIPTASTEGLFDVTIGAGIAAIEGAWSFSLDQFGLLALPIAIATLLATAWVTDQLLSLGSEVLR